jgi:hypothetical protein
MTVAPNAPQPVAVTEPPATLAAAHAELLGDESLQFQFEVYEPPQPPDWIEPLLRLLQAVAPFLGYIFWAGVAIVVLLILYVIGSEILRRLPDRRAKSSAVTPHHEEYRPAPARAQALLNEADRLAAEGRYGEAVRVLLHRSIEDLENKFALIIGPGVTSREITGLAQLSERGRSVFSGIAQAVEISLFGGRQLSADDFAQCRQAYASFALPGTSR